MDRTNHSHCEDRDEMGWEYNALFLAAFNNRAEEVRDLLEGEFKGKVNELNREGCSALDFSIIEGQIEASKVLIEYGVDINREDYQPPMHRAAMSYTRVSEAITLMVDNGADLNYINEMGMSVLFRAETPEAVKILLSLGVNPEHKDSDGDTALHYMLKMGKREPARELVKITKLLSIENNDGKTPMDILFDTIEWIENHPY